MNEHPEQLLQVINISKGGIVIAHRVKLADISSERRRGLLGCKGISADEGMYLAPCEWLHTFGMRFAIDVAFVSASGLILATYHGLKPNRLSRIVWRAYGALELSEGALRKSATSIGDTVQLLSIKSVAPSPSNLQNPLSKEQSIAIIVK